VVDPERPGPRRHAAARRAQHHTHAHPATARLALLRLPQAALAAAGTRGATFSPADVTVAVAAGLPVEAATADQVRQQMEALTDQALSFEQAVEVSRVQEGVTAGAPTPGGPPPNCSPSRPAS
jgi:hypothetical protein